VSKLIAAGSFGFHHQIAPRLKFLVPTFIFYVLGEAPCERQFEARLGVGINDEKGFLTNNSLYVGNYRRYAHRYSGILIGSRILAFDWYQF